MSVWIWILVGVGGLLAVSLVVGVALAAILANIGREFSRLAELEPCASSPLTRAQDSAAQHAAGQLSRRGRGSSTRLV